MPIHAPHPIPACTAPAVAMMLQNSSTLIATSLAKPVETALGGRHFPKQSRTLKMGTDPKLKIVQRQRLNILNVWHIAQMQAGD